MAKLISSYNSTLNRFKGCLKPLIDAESIHPETMHKLELLHSLRMLCNEPQTLLFKENKVSKMPTPVISNTVRENPLAACKRTNWDGLKISEEHSIVFKSESSIKKDRHGIMNLSCGLAFAFESLGELLDMLKHSIETATVTQLVWEQCNPSGHHFGMYVPIGNYFFSLDLELNHVPIFASSVRDTITRFAKINSASTKIMHWLTKNSIQKDQLYVYLDSSIENSFHNLRTTHPELCEYQSVLIKRIKQLISQMHDDPSFPISSIDCYSESCKHTHMFLRESSTCESKKLICQKCRRTEMCKLCGNKYHGNSPCNATDDEATEYYIRTTTKPCPTCRANVDKDGGCNHMACKRCNSHFCWTCLEVYTLDMINDHYINMNPYGLCRRGQELQRQRENNVQANAHPVLLVNGNPFPEDVLHFQFEPVIQLPFYLIDRDHLRVQLEGNIQMPFPEPPLLVRQFADQDIDEHVILAPDEQPPLEEPDIHRQAEILDIAEMIFALQQDIEQNGGAFIDFDNMNDAEIAQVFFDRLG